ncbi:MAG: antitoxin VapB family protein [Candidatus Heimdallarchaeum aukensis]|uniref:Antitoxin VapB family protein n=1 Tax=Candidatus Heimdallarchaeum aukensis TaxID=2876573 RepID=A0A9Y1BLN7_9ARCH|nr:MAG: antitoxin VapB family protein [Candidatus Heimdallarchaeum aukensis]
MAKNIAISDELYKLLKRLKRPGESFTDVILRSIKHSTSIMDITGKKTIPLEEWEKLKKLFEMKEIELQA